MSELPEILIKVKSKGHRIFTRGSYNLNIIGVRTASRQTNTFDDKLHLVYKDEFDNWVDHQFQITTDPGAYWLDNPMKVTGTAILVAGQYRSSHKIGLHRGKYTALVQRGSVKVYRDDNKDAILDHDITSVTEGYYGINIHRANSSRESTVVHKWSAGCQVFSDPREYDIFIAVCQRSALLYGDTFTYTLIEE